MGDTTSRGGTHHTPIRRDGRVDRRCSFWGESVLGRPGLDQRVWVDGGVPDHRVEVGQREPVPVGDTTTSVVRPQLAVDEPLGDEACNCA